jgi:hypothetical protein
MLVMPDTIVMLASNRADLFAAKAAALTTQISAEIKPAANVATPACIHICEAPTHDKPPLRQLCPKQFRLRIGERSASPTCHHGSTCTAIANPHAAANSMKINNHLIQDEDAGADTLARIVHWSTLLRKPKVAHRILPVCLVDLQPAMDKDSYSP